MIPEHWRRAALTPSTAWGAALGTGMFRATPEDFEVDEILGFTASGEGPHALLRVRKRGANTEWVARELARSAGVKPFEVGFAGLKDRNAVTTQHFTVPRGKRAAEEFVGVAGEGYEVLSAEAHQRKLPRGALDGNRFTLSVRGLSCDSQLLNDRMARIAAGGVPNYFGEQRFGREAGNLAQVLRAADVPTGASTDRARRRGRGRDEQTGFMLSAARSLIFNAILAERVDQGTWNRLSVGDVANLDGRGSVFPVQAMDADLEQRCSALAVHPTAPLLGEGASLASGEVLEQEVSASNRFPEALAVIRGERMNSERRALRIRIRELEHEYSADVLRLRFVLPAGSFATTVLREIIAGAATGE
jgi:tRNA pseudouridine13 synthase